MTRKDAIKLIIKTRAKLRLADAALGRLREAGLRESNAPLVLESSVSEVDILKEFVIVEQMIVEAKELIDGVKSWKLEKR